MTAFGFIEGHRVAHLVAVLFEFLGVDHHAIGLSAANPVELGLGGKHGGQGLLIAFRNGYAGEQTNITELAGIMHGEHAALAATHGQTSHGGVGVSLGHAVVLLNKVHDVREAVFHLDGALATAVGHGGLEHVYSGTGSGLIEPYAIGHDYNHGLGIPLCNEVVHNLGGTAQVCPGIFISTGAVQQVQNRITVQTVFVTGRGVDGEATLAAEGGAVVPDVGQGAVRHVLHLIIPAQVSGLCA